MDEAREVLHNKDVEVQERLMLLKERELKLKRSGRRMLTNVLGLLGCFKVVCRFLIQLVILSVISRYVCL